MDCKRAISYTIDNEKRNCRKRHTSFTEALKEKYLAEEIQTVGYIIVSPKRKTSCSPSSAELAHLQTVVLNNMNLNRAGIPQQGLSSLCPNIVDLDIANNQFEQWSELLQILCHLPRVKYVNVSRNSLKLNSNDDLPETLLSVENLALNDTGVSIVDVVKLSQLLPQLKELHLCANRYEDLANIDKCIKEGHLSSLECLRLNNNSIKSWSEVWKLRHLPQLKDLILSGNPLDQIFYEEDIFSAEDNCNDTKSSEVSDNENDTVCEEEIFLPMSTDCNDCNMNGSDFDSEEFLYRDILTSENSDGNEEEDFVCRPVSRIDRHKESDVSDDDITCSSLVSSVTDMEIGSVSPHNTNFNNVHTRLNSKSLYDSDPGEESANWFGVFPNFDGEMENFFEYETPPDETTTEEEEEDDWHKAIAEAFLLDIINNLDFSNGHEGSPTVPQLSLSNHAEPQVGDSPSISSCEDTQIVAASNPVPVSDGIHEDTQEPHEGDTNQNASFESQGHSCNTQSENQQESISYSPSMSKDVKLNPHITPSKDTTTTRAKRNLSKELGKESLNQNLLCKNCGKPFPSASDPSEYNASSDFSDEAMSSQLTENCMPQSSTNCQCFKVISCSSLSDRSNNTDKPPSEPDSLKNKDKISENQSSNVQQQKNDNEASSNSVPFRNLEVLCLSNGNVSHWKHLNALSSFPKLTNIRMLENPLYSSVHPEDRRKLYISSLPNVKILNGSEVGLSEREKAERHYLRYYMDSPEKPDFYHTLVKKHGPPVKLVEIDISAGYQEWANLSFVLDGVFKFTKNVHLTEPVGKLRILISKELNIPKHCFTMHHNMCAQSHPESEREILELRCEGLPMSRYDFYDGDEICICQGQNNPKTLTTGNKKGVSFFIKSS